AHRLPRFLDQVERRISIPEKLLRAAIADVPRGPDSALEQPGLVVETVRIDGAVRPPQAHREEPALPRVQRAREDRRRFLIEWAAIPREQELLRQARLAR